jgi:TolB protein
MGIMGKLLRHRWTCAVAGGLLILVLVCSAGIAAVAWYQLRPDFNRAPPIDRIAHVGMDGNIYIIDRHGKNRLALTQDAETLTQSSGRLYRFPTWSPDSQLIAFVSVEFSRGQGQTNTLYAASTDSGKLTPLFSSQESGPFYLYWSPNSSRVAFLASESDGLSLRLAGMDGQTRLLDTGSPFYFTWGPDSDTLITHVGGAVPFGRIGRLKIDADQSETLVETPALFLAPAWSPTKDEVLFAANLDEEGPALYLVDSRSDSRRVLVRYDGAISFVWSPQGDRLAYIITNRPRPSGLGQFAFGPIQVLQPGSDKPQTVSTEDALAFFWSPDGQKIAYLSVATRDSDLEGRLIPSGTRLQQDRQFRLRWHVADLRSSTDRALPAFVPAGGFLSLIPFFDQYAQSLTLWSPDSTAIVYSARNSDGSSDIWIVATDGQSPAQRIVDGDLPVWSWR